MQFIKCERPATIGILIENDGGNYTEYLSEHGGAPWKSSNSNKLILADGQQANGEKM